MDFSYPAGLLTLGLLAMVGRTDQGFSHEKTQDGSQHESAVQASGGGNGD